MNIQQMQDNLQQAKTKLADLEAKHESHEQYSRPDGRDLREQIALQNTLVCFMEQDIADKCRCS